MLGEQDCGIRHCGVEWPGGLHQAALKFGSRGCGDSRLLARQGERTDLCSHGTGFAALFIDLASSVCTYTCLEGLCLVKLLEYKHDEIM